MKALCQTFALVIVQSFLGSGCFSHNDEPKTIALDYCILEVVIQGESQASILKRWGEPSRKLTENFESLEKERWYKQKRVSVPAFDEQWIYTKPGKPWWRIVCFKNKIVSLCVEQWSDF